VRLRSLRAACARLPLLDERILRLRCGKHSTAEARHTDHSGKSIHGPFPWKDLTI
jgi:hypothetical protein